MNSLQPVSLLGGIAPNNAANTAAATSGWIDVRQIHGDIRFVSDVGVVTGGSITPGLEDATSAAGAGSAPITPIDGAFTAVTTGNDPLREVRHLRAKATRGFVRYVGVVATGPAQVAVTIEGIKKY